LRKAKFLQKEYCPTNIFSEGGQNGVEIVFAKPQANRSGKGCADFTFSKCCQEI